MEGGGGWSSARKVQCLPVLQVYLGAYYYTGNGIHPTEVNNLVVHDVDHVEGFVVRDGIHEDIAVDANSVFAIENCVLVLGARGLVLGARGQE